MTSAGHPPATGSVEFTDAISASRDLTATSPLGRAALAALRAAPLLDGRPWHWRLHDDVAELWIDPIHARDPADPVSLVVGGAALHRTRIALASAGWDSRVDRLPDPRRPGLLALLRQGARRPTTAGDAQAYRAVLSGHTGKPATATGAAAPPSTLHRLRDTAERGGAGLRLLPAGDPAVVAAGGPVLLAALGFPGAATERGASHAILYARSASARGALLAGEALSALTVVAAAGGATIAPEAIRLATPDASRALTRLLPGGASPLLLLRIGAQPAWPGRATRPATTATTTEVALPFAPREEPPGRGVGPPG